MLLLNIEPADDKGPRYIRADHYKKVVIWVPDYV